MGEKVLDEVKDHLEMTPIGHIRRRKDEIDLEIFKPYIPALKQLGHFSHVMVFWWADRHDNEKDKSMMQTRPPYASKKLTGVFSCRAEYRPNPIAITTCKIINVDEENGIVKIKNIDAFDGTQIVDLKPYFPVCDRVKEAHIPDWLIGWPEWMPEDGIGLEE